MNVIEAVRGAGVEIKARERFLALLRENFPLHREEFGLDVDWDLKHIQVGYGEAVFFPRLMLERPVAIFNVFPGDYCDIISFDIPEGFRRQGNGRKLYSCIEDLARGYDCKKVVTTPSGQGKKFWVKMGSSDEGRLGWEKRLE